ncbi:MAG TPA: YkgJ family cysteine cluster protein [Polyangia bacterium]|nr:YkgJ family cysteine cluster protein [Polyangia bacterium]
MTRDRPSPLATSAIDAIWAGAARALGFTTDRTTDCYASSDGAGRILIGAAQILDVDDSFAQLVCHELCHALVQGPRRHGLPDWGLDVSGGADTAREHACLRVQAHLARPFGLRPLMAPTTEYRAYYEALPEDALALDGDPAAELARAALAGDLAAPWVVTLRQALAATAALVSEAALTRHPLGFMLGPPTQTCASCAWLYIGGRGRAVERCRQKNLGAPAAESAARTRGDFPACEKWEAPVRCETCGACCREAYHIVSVSMRDPVVWKQPQLIVRHGPKFEILRDGDRCAALAVESPAAAPAPLAPLAPPPSRYRCRIYEDRPATCREFATGGQHCLQARQRVGLSR